MNRLITRALLPSALCLLAACSTTSAPPAASSSTQPTRAPDSVPPVATAPSNGLTKEDLAALRDPKNPLYKRSVFFDYDSNLIKTEQQPVVETHGKFLAKKPGVKVTVQGNTDERGSREYNLALGQRRAEAVKQALNAMGVAGDQVETVSFGAEKPAVEGHDEKAWAKNRHADIVYPEQ